MKTVFKTTGVFFACLIAMIGFAFVFSMGSQKAAVAMISFSPVVALGAAISYYKGRKEKVNENEDETD
jgi:uncharacterized membrane protein